ncbi:hypothetical protein C8R42DRAFT_647005 [Lentinula raphanica]|nr:hypothetical protein C8R42DRAFT_647005 [Lentinula raphanica]
MVKMRFDIALFSSLAVYAMSAMPVPADNGGNNASPNHNDPSGNHFSDPAPEGTFRGQGSVRNNVFGGSVDNMKYGGTSSDDDFSDGDSWSDHSRSGTVSHSGSGSSTIWIFFAPKEEPVWTCPFSHLVTHVYDTNPMSSSSTVTFKPHNVPTGSSGNEHGHEPQLSTRLDNVLREVFKGAHAIRQEGDQKIQPTHVGDDSLMFTIELTENVNIGGLMGQRGEVVSFDVIGNTVAAVNFGRGNWIFAGLGNLYPENARQSVVFPRNLLTRMGWR